MEKDKWVFYTDLFGNQRWERLNRYGETIAESAGSFCCLADAMADAARSGFVSQDGCVTSALEWKVSGSACLKHEPA